MNKIEFQKIANELIGNRCWQVTAAVITGSRVNLHFGKRIESEVGKNRRIVEEGELGIQIGSAQWRVSKGETILSSSVEILENDEPAIAGLHLLEGKQVVDVVVHGLFDLWVKFENGIELSVFCNDTDDGADNYSISIRGRYYTVECNERTLTLSIED